MTPAARLFVRGVFNLFLRVRHFDAAHGNILAGGHFIAHEVLKDHADFGVQGGQVIFAKIDAVKQNLAFGWIVETRDELDHGGLALTIFANQSHTLPGQEREIEVFEDAPVGAGIDEGDISEFEAAQDRIGRRQAAGLDSTRGFISKKQADR
jgi:hypothetical protein